MRNLKLALLTLPVSFFVACTPRGTGLIDGCRVDSDCDDGVFCNGIEACDGGTCQAGDPVCACGCHEDLDTCYECCSDAECDDGDECTTDACTDGNCAHVPGDCDDGDSCTNDACVDGDCTHVARDCDDGDACTDDVCTNGSCAHAARDCNDGVDCTADGCDAAAGGCTHTDACPVGQQCDAATSECIPLGCAVDTDCPDDGIYCNGDPYCFDGECAHLDGNAACENIGPCDEMEHTCVPAFESELCLGPCDVSLLTCFRTSVDEFEGFEDALAAMIDAVEFFPCEGEAAGLYAGQCTGETVKFLALTDGLHAVVDFYEVADGSFLGQRSWSDFGDDACWGRKYWPVVVSCDEPVITQALCGTRWTVGSEVDLVQFWR